MNEIQEKALSKLESEAESVSGHNVPAIGIYQFLKEQCESDEGFAQQVLIDTKKMSKCFLHIQEQAYEIAKKQTRPKAGEPVGVGMSSEEIFALVRDYYFLDDAEIERQKEEKRKADEAKRKEEAEKSKAEQEKRAAEAKAKKKAGKSKKPTSEKKPKTAAEKPSKAPENGQLNLFDV